ncbi:MAG: alpha-mannosidase 2c1 [Lentisphaerae bacterium RIFOXYB12_FULL_65_16]|nr:MAG: alpha-mannosidase 2c1 [Lentisphaerae bacterium RIFOXYA12_64_32]OGV92869.1 MAG: alpha-mannosidase 2c1 [Lentisphaerae bacterium RIFOXYB12_FULL_65_16]
MHEEKNNLLRGRVDQFYNRTHDRVIAASVPLAAGFAPSKDPVPFKDRLKAKYRSIQEGAEWGQTWDSAWFKLTATVPREWKGKTVAAQLDFNGEGLVSRKDGVPLQGITNGSVFKEGFGRDIVRLFEPCKGGEKVELWVETAANGLFGVEKEQDPAQNCPTRHGNYLGKVNRMRLCVLDEEMWHLRLDMEILKDLANNLPGDSVRRARIFRCLNEAIDAFADNPANAAQSRAVLQREMDRPACSSDLTVTAVGHAHIDTGWLWRVRESYRKCARTFSSQIRLIERYPGYVFGASQAQLYAFTKERYPELYAKIQRQVKAGGWEVQGGMWVEADCNVISGESMVRQFLHGKNFFMDEFGVDVRNLWLPDVFGYSAALPQILKKTGCDFFVTQKISWNQFNLFPHHTFVWRGIDGSEVITHFPPENNYNSLLMPRALLAGQRRFKEKDLVDGYLSLFGVGDGGGGPREEDIERGLRQKDLEGAPKVRFGPAQKYLDGLRKYDGKLETWVGELYLELHRGTLTTQSWVKRGNRKLEQRLRQVEFLCACLPLEQYPQDDFDAIWKMLLRNQFHDIIPGSSITEVYQDTLNEYADAEQTCTHLADRAAGKLFHKDKKALVLFNCLSCTYDDPVRLPAAWRDSAIEDAAGQPVPVQREADGAVALATVPAQGFLTLRKATGKPAAAKPSHDLVLENARVRYEFAADGTLSGAFDKEAGCDILAGGAKGNVLSLYIDRPHNWDAWEVDITYENELLETARCVTAKSVAAGPVRQRLQFAFTVGVGSKIVQDVTLAANSKRLDFQTVIDWAEKHRMLRVAFPTRVESPKASFDIQYGYTERPTHRNTSWDMARFEVVAHRYVDLSGPDYGIALLNDCKYAHKVHHNVIDLNLLRAPTYPDPDADQGRHEVTYSLLPHTGTLVQSNVMTEAMKLNQGMAAFDGCRADSAQAPCRLEGAGLSLEVLKKAEKENCRVIRLVETRGSRSSGTLTVADPATRLVETNLMEWTDGRAVACAKPITVTLDPFEIRTYKIVSVKKRA